MSDKNPALPRDGTQERRVYDRLIAANGEWINKQVFVREMFLTQAGRAIWTLQNRFHIPVESSPFTDEHGFKSYRIVQRTIQPAYQTEPTPEPCCPSLDL